MNDYLTKPIERRKLLQALETWAPRHEEAALDLNRFEGLPVMLTATAETRPAMTANLEALGLRVTSADTAALALEVLGTAADRNETWPLVVVSGDLPDMAGAELAGVIGAIPGLSRYAPLLFPNGPDTSGADVARRLAGIRPRRPEDNAP